MSEPNEPKRRFFSGDSLQQALVQAANHYNLDPSEINYRSIEKKHGFIKVRRKVVIEVDPAAPRRDPSLAVAAPPPEMPAAAAAEPRAEAPRAESPRPPMARPPREGGDRSPRGDRPPRERRDRRDDRGGRPPREDRRDDRRGDRPRMAPLRPRREQPDAGARPAWSDAPPPPRPLGFGGDLIALPDAPRRTAERFPPAEGPQAEAAAKGAELLLRVAGLDLAPRVLQGEERLEVDLSGPDVDWCFADDGELVLAIEHLLPRLIRSLSGEAALVRVDCDNFQEIREERLRSLAQQVADEVRRRGKPRILEPMNPADRRIIHMTLADDPAVMTESEGDGYFKRIAVKPASA
jgi:spoIIIJ-associated protein